MRTDSVTTDSSYYQVKNFVVRFSDHIHGNGREGVSVSVAVAYNKSDCYIIQLDDSPIPLVMNWKEVIDVIKTSFYSYMFKLKTKEVENAKALREIDTCIEWGLYSSKIADRYPQYQFISAAKKTVFKEYFETGKLKGLALMEAIMKCVETLGIKRCDTVKPMDVRDFMENYIKGK